MESELKLLMLIVVANGAPVIASKLLAGLYDCPLDGGRLFFDKKPLFGNSKTVRGIVAALVTTIPAGLLLGIPVHFGATLAFFAMVGDLISSFIKRRLGKQEGARFIGLDQVPESLLPLLVLQPEFGLSAMSITGVVVAFVIFELVFSRIFYWLHIRKHPY